MKGSTVSKNPSTSVRPSLGPGRSSFRPGSRTGAAEGRRIPNPMVSGMKKSDEAVLPVKAANKGAQAPAEPPEGRASTKGNLRDQSTPRTQGRDGVSQAVERIRQAATRKPQEKRAHSRFPGTVCRQRWTVRLGEVEPVFGQTGRVLLDITARTAHDGALKWTRPSTPRAARSILATFPSTCALPSGGRWSLRRVLQRPGRQRKWSSAKSSCGPSRTSSSAPSSPPCCNARCARPRLATRRAPSCATCPGGCGATAWRPSTFAPPGARRCRSRRRTTARNTPVGRSGGRDSTP